MVIEKGGREETHRREVARRWRIDLRERWPRLRMWGTVNVAGEIVLDRSSRQRSRT